MSAVSAQAAAIVGMLAAATGGQPRTEEAGRSIRIEADLPDQMSHAARMAILDALATANRYGHARTENSNLAWAELDREAEQ